MASAQTDLDILVHGSCFPSPIAYFFPLASIHEQVMLAILP